jgi:pimeloyl-ACP methyl ester carboxylesterase
MSPARAATIRVRLDAAAGGYDRMIATFALIHGAGDVGWYWHLVVAELEKRGHEAVAMDLPSDDESAGWPDYVDAVVGAIGDRSDVVVVAQSFGGFVAPLVPDRLPVELIVLVAAMVPNPGETGNDWWANTGYAEAAREQAGDGSPAADDEIAIFYPDVDPALAEEALSKGRDQADIPGPLPLEAWPDVPTRFLLCLQDRMFPADWLRGVVRDRLGFDPDEIDCGHTPALSRPEELTGRLVAYWDEL